MKYKIQKGLIVEKLDNDLVIFDADQSVLYTLNETAAYIFQQLKKGNEKEAIIEGLLKKYDVKKARAEKDFDELVEKLKEKGILK